MPAYKKLLKSISTKVLSLHIYFQVLHHLQSWWPIFSFRSHQDVAADQESLSSIHSLSQQEGLRGEWLSPGLWEECQLAGVTEGGLEQKLLFMYCTDLGFNAYKLWGRKESEFWSARPVHSHWRLQRQTALWVSTARSMRETWKTLKGKINTSWNLKKR